MEYITKSPENQHKKCQKPSWKRIKLHQS